FFFQAEDGIRDFYVTGVQTCALPIYEYALRAERGGDRESRFHLRRVDLHGVEADLGRRQTAEPVLDQRCGPAVVVDEAAFGELQIGRASRRERMWIEGRCAPLTKQQT